MRNLKEIFHEIKWKLKNFITYASVFKTRDDINGFRRCRHATSNESGAAVSLSIRPLGGVKQLCRCGTSDPQVLLDVFYYRYHVPPQTVSNVDVIVDLGANVGYTLAHWGVLYPDARIIGVEMDVANAEMARQNSKFLEHRCSVETAAIWPEDGEVLYSGEESWGLAVSTVGERKSRAISMKTLFMEQAISKIDILKVDIEGAERELFSNDTAWLENVRAIILEVHAPLKMLDFVQLLSRNGFTCRSGLRDTSIWAMR